MPTHYHGPEQEVLTLDTFIKLTRAYDSLTNRLTRSKIWDNLTESQFGVLEILYHLGPLSQSAICTKLLKSGGNTTLVVDNLEKQALVRRTTSFTDRRVTLVELTPQGKALITHIFPEIVAFLTREFSILTPAEQAELGRLCKILGKQNKQSHITIQKEN